MTTARTLKPLIAAIVASSALSLGGCLSIDPFHPETDPGSAAKAAVAEAEAKHRAYPRWSEFPARPEGLAGPIEVRGDVQTLQGGAEALYGWVRANPPLAGDGAAWAERTRGAIDPRLAHTPPADAAAEAEAFARRLREQAAPPAPVQ